MGEEGQGGRGGAGLNPVLPGQSLCIMVKAQDVTTYKASGQVCSGRTVLLFIPASVRWQLSSIQIGTTFRPELGKHDKSTEAWELGTREGEELRARAQKPGVKLIPESDGHLYSLQGLGLLM